MGEYCRYKIEYLPEEGTLYVQTTKKGDTKSEIRNLKVECPFEFYKYLQIYWGIAYIEYLSDGCEYNCCPKYETRRIHDAIDRGMIKVIK